MNFDLVVDVADRAGDVAQVLRDVGYHGDGVGAAAQS